MSASQDRTLVLVKHALPVLDASRPAREWQLGPEGEAQARWLAAELKAFLPFRLVSSMEPKASQTADVVARALAIDTTPVEDLGELDRPALPIMTRDGHERFNARLFTSFDEPVVGAESARAARDRFSAAVFDLLRQEESRNLVIVSHGTVIALLVAAHNPLEAFELWKRLDCSAFVVLDAASFELRRISDSAPRVRLQEER